MTTWIEIVEAGFNQALSKLNDTIERGFMALKDKISELQVAASEERLQAKSRFDKLDAEIAQLKELLAGNESLVAQLTQKINEKDGIIGEKDSSIADLTSQLDASKSEIAESLEAIDDVVAEVKAIVE
jgi:chromosome segregation ATPase